MILHTLSYTYSMLTVIWTAQTFRRAVSGTVWEIHLCHPVSYLICDTSFYRFLFCGSLAMPNVDVGHHQCATKQETVESNMEASCLLTSVLFIAMCLKRARNVHINTDVSITANQSFNWQTNACFIHSYQDKSQMLVGVSGVSCPQVWKGILLLSFWKCVWYNFRD